MNFYKEGNLIKRISVIKTQWEKVPKDGQQNKLQKQDCWAKFGKPNFKVTGQQRTHSPQFEYETVKDTTKNFPLTYSITCLSFLISFVIEYTYGEKIY